MCSVHELGAGTEKSRRLITIVYIRVASNDTCIMYWNNN